VTTGATAFSRRPPTSRAGLADLAPMSELGRALIVLGVVIAAVGLLLVLFGRLPWLGRLPGDIAIQRGNWSFYFPLGTSILLSIVLTLLLWLIGRR
jgi:DUF2905 family protein